MALKPLKMAHHFEKIDERLFSFVGLVIGLSVYPVAGGMWLAQNKDFWQGE